MISVATTLVVVVDKAWRERKKKARLSLRMRPRALTRSLRDVPPKEDTAHRYGNSLRSGKRAEKSVVLTILTLCSQ